MTIPERIYRIARQRMMEKLGMVQGAAFRSPHGSPHDAAREELEQFLGEPAPPPVSGPPPEEPRRAAAPHPYTREYRLLGAPVGSDLATVQQCWRRLVRENHPDRFACDPESQRFACERLRRINDAYDRLRGYLEG
jgi:DnaJ-domain-containing protein 1